VAARNSVDIAPDEYWYSVAADEARAHSVLLDRSVVVTGIAWPTGDHPEWHVSCVSDPVSDVPGHIVKAPRPHLFGPCMALSVDQDQHSLPFQGGIELRAIGVSVKVAVRHEIFIAYPAWMNHRVSPKEATLGALNYRLDPLHFVNQGFGVIAAQLSAS
jgi:hypothetical protein